MQKKFTHALLALFTSGFSFFHAQAQTWTNVGSLWSSDVETFKVYNDNLYIGGNFTSQNSSTCTFMAYYDGSTVYNTNDSELGGSGFVALEEHNGVLYGGGTSNNTSGAAMAMEWSGSSWGNSSMFINTNVNALKSFGGYLWVGGLFTTAQGVTCNRVAKWDDDAQEYTAAANGFDGGVSSFEVYNNNLYAAGGFTHSGSTAINRIAKWNGTDWEALSTGVNGSVYGMAVYKNELYVMGNFTQAGAVSVTGGIAKWNGTSWSAVGTGLTLGPNKARTITADATYLYVGGDITAAGGNAVKNVAKWDGTNWSAVGDLSGEIVNSLYSWNGYLYAGLYYLSNKNLVRKALITTTTGTNDPETTEQASLFYNNDQSQIEINFNQLAADGVLQLSVYTADGRQLLNVDNLDAGKNKISFKPTSGLYIAAVKAGDQYKQMKFFVR